MNKYHCTKCNKEVVTQSQAKEVSLKCCNKEEPVLHKLGDAPKKEAKSVTPATPPAK